MSWTLSLAGGRSGIGWQYDDYPETLFNPVFIGMVLALLIVGDTALARFLDRRFPTPQKPIRFVSERKTVSLLPDEILYIESNDKEVTVNANYATLISPDTVTIGTAELTVSRKYKEEVQTILTNHRA